MAIKWLEKTSKGGRKGSSAPNRFIAVSSATKGSKTDPRHVLVISLTVDAMKEMRLQIGDRLQLGFEGEDTEAGWLVLRRSHASGAVISSSKASAKGDYKSARGTVAAGVCKYAGAPFDLPRYQYSPLTRKDVIIDGDLIKFPIEYLSVFTPARPEKTGPIEKERRVLGQQH